MGAALLQHGQAVAYASHALLSAETRYAQIEKELLAILFACEKFHLYNIIYIYARNNVTIQSDHKPLENIFQTPLNNAPARLQRMSLMLQKDDIRVKFTPGKELYVADTLSRAYLPNESVSASVAAISEASSAENLAMSANRLKKLRTASRNDASLQHVAKLAEKGWPARHEVPDVAMPYYSVDTASKTLPIVTGVPQGSILGPLLFLIYLNDFPLSSNFFKFIMYADDTTLYSQLDNARIANHDIELEINNELTNINDWLKINKLALNKKKSKYMISTKAHSEPKILELKIDNINIEYVNFFNFLGLTIDSRLTWENHTINMSNKCLRIIGTLNRIKYFVPLNIRLMLYNTLILPHLNYCVTAWGYQCNRIIKLQKKAIRTVMISSYNAHTEPFFKNLKLLKIQDIVT